MIRRVTKLATALIVAAAISAPGSAFALPTAQITDPPLVPVQVGDVITFDASASICDFPPCRYIWTWYYPSGITGGQMGQGEIIDFAFPAEAAGRLVAVVVKVVDNTFTHGFGTSTVRVSVLAADPVVTPPVVTPPVVTPPVVTPVDTVVTPVDTVVTPVDTVVTPVDTTPVDTTPVATPVDTTPVDTTPVATPVDTVVTPVDPVVTPPVDPVVTPPKPVRVRHGGHAKRGA
jgi:hypothetical protein